MLENPQAAHEISLARPRRTVFRLRLPMKGLQALRMEIIDVYILAIVAQNEHRSKYCRAETFMAACGARGAYEEFHLEDMVALPTTVGFLKIFEHCEYVRWADIAWTVALP